jgi:TPR repeat protein
LLRENGDVDGLCEIDKIFASEIELPSTAANGRTPYRDEFEAALYDAAADGNASAMNSLAVLLGQTNREQQAREWFTHAAESGNDIAEENLAAEREVKDENSYDSSDPDEEAC